MYFINYARVFSCVKKAKHGWYIPWLNLHIIPIFRNCELQNIVSVQLNLKRSSLYENIFNAIIASIILPFNVYIFYIFLIVLFSNSADLCSLGAPTKMVDYCLLFLIIRCLIITVVHQQRQHYGCDELWGH